MNTTKSRRSRAPSGSMVDLKSSYAYPYHSRIHRFHESTLGQISKIERLRWRNLVIIATVRHRRQSLTDEIIASGGECFLPPRRNAEARPTRLVCYRNAHGIGCSSVDESFWCYKRPLTPSNDIEVIAAATHRADWNQIELPARIARSTEPIKRELGRRWRSLAAREAVLWRRADLANALLMRGILMSKILPNTVRECGDTIDVIINTRRYSIAVSSEDDIGFRPINWPTTICNYTVLVPEHFVVDQSLIGVDKDAVRVRLGEPIATSKDDIDWYYHDGKITFSGLNSGNADIVISVVESIYSDSDPAPINLQVRSATPNSQ